MKCPVDGTELLMSDRQGVEIDYCPTCRGVWLDRGELDKIIERSATAAPSAPRPAHERHAADNRSVQQPGYDGEQQYGKPYKKRRSFLDDIFDF